MSAAVAMARAAQARRKDPARYPQTGLAEPEVYTITPAQRNVHVTFEALAVFVAVPFTAYLAMSPRLKPWERTGLAAMTLATIVVDGGLLYSYMKKKKGVCP